MFSLFSGFFYFFRLFIETWSLAISFMLMNLVIRNQLEFVILALQNNYEQKMVFWWLHVTQQILLRQR